MVWDARCPVSWGLRRVGRICWQVERGREKWIPIDVSPLACAQMHGLQFAILRREEMTVWEIVNAMMIRPDLRWILMNP